ncbi:MAG: phenylalanine--tRNA ligase subunit beta [Clostridia bacterium]|nr:phenylalanine--tRNA ligase subunit beta [Clostridia bacterium]
MKLSLNWIKDYVDIPSDLELSRIAYDLTMSTVEVEDIIELGKKFDKMLVGVIKEVVPHPNADKLRICKTDIGGGDIRDIVCGGSNLEKDMKVAVACPGAVVRWHGEGEPVEIKKAKLRGVESYGMICAPSEIGLFELFSFVDESEILDLSEFSAKAGTPLADALGLNDVIFEIDNKSLTNRPDLWGHYGIARELSAIYNLPLKEFTPFEVPTVPKLKIEVENSSLCPRYIGVEIEGLTAKTSPFELQSRIWRVGMRPINTIVDITNYLLLATGQPTHAFDFNSVKGNINVRNAKKSEKLLLLNGKELTLSTSDLVIADDERLLSLAGIMGGEEVTVLNQTDKIILEIANFEPYTIRRTISKYDLRTESGIRYEKGIDPERCDIALSLAMEMLSELFPQMKITGFCDKYSKSLEKKKIKVSLDWLEKRLGKRIPNSEITNKLERLGFEIKVEKDIMNITVPTWRSTGDVSLMDDILEEVARMHGFENFESMPITTTFEKIINQPEIDLERKIREYLAFRCGMNEIFTYPWTDEEYIKAIFSNINGMLSLSAPPSPNEKYIRSSLLPGLIKATAENLRYFNEFKIFESAQVFFNEFSKSPYDEKELLPKHCRNVAGAFVGSFENIDYSFRMAKGVISELPTYVHAEPLTFEKNEKPIWADNDIWLNIIQNGNHIGDFALLSRKVALDCGIKNSAVFVFEMNIDLLKLYPSRTNKFVQLPEYPLTSRDLSLLFDLSVKWKDILEVIKKKHDDLLQDIIYVGEYKGKQISDDKKSVTFKLVIGSLKKTLTSQEIDNCVNNIVKRLEKNLNAKFR